MAVQEKLEALETRVSELESKLTTRAAIDEEYARRFIRKARAYGFMKLFGVEVAQDGSRSLVCPSSRQDYTDYYARELCSLAEEMVRCLATEA